jgi:hypothetical protein
MIAAIITRLKTGKIKSVIPFGTIDTPAPPYIVVKQEVAMSGNGHNIRVTVHMKPDQQQALDDFVRDDLSTLLSEWAGTSHNGAYNQLDKGIDEFPVLIIGNDDGTIAMERVFLLPSVLF